MVPKTDNTEFQLEVLKAVRNVYETESDLTDRMLLKSLFDNYRSGGGMRLSKFGIELCSSNKLYEFTKISIPRDINKSVLFTALDRICKTPYYVDSSNVYLSDEIVVTELTFCCDDFEKLFSMYL